MIPPKGWRARAAAAKARSSRVLSAEELDIRRQRDALLAERQTRLDEEAAAKAQHVSGITTAARMGVPDDPGPEPESDDGIEPPDDEPAGDADDEDGIEPDDDPVAPVPEPAPTPGPAHAPTPKAAPKKATAKK